MPNLLLEQRSPSNSRCNEQAWSALRSKDDILLSLHRSCFIHIQACPRMGGTVYTTDSHQVQPTKAAAPRSGPQCRTDLFCFVSPAIPVEPEMLPQRAAGARPKALTLPHKQHQLQLTKCKSHAGQLNTGVRICPRVTLPFPIGSLEVVSNCLTSFFSSLIIQSKLIAYFLLAHSFPMVCFSCSSQQYLQKLRNSRSCIYHTLLVRLSSEL